MKNSFFLAGMSLFLFYGLSVHAELPPEEQWVASYAGTVYSPDTAHALAVDSSGNIYVTGSSCNNFLSESDYATIKYDPNGNILWIARYRGHADYENYANALAVDASGNVYVTGSSYDPNKGFDYATIKYDPNGEQLWAARYNGTANDYDDAYDLVIDDLGNVYVTGGSSDSSTGYDYATIKYDPNGEELWVACYNRAADNATCALGMDVFGNVYVTGSSYDPNTGLDYTTIKYDPNGNKLWEARYSASANSNEWANDIAVDGSGSVYVTGLSDPNVPIYDYADYVTVKYDPNGSEVWAAGYDDAPNPFNHAKALVVDHSGNVYVTGRSYGTGFDYATIKYEPNGNQLWAARYNGPGNYHDEPADLAIDNYGNVYVSGKSWGDDTSNDYATIKYGPNGNELWVVRYDGPGNDDDIAESLAVDNAGNVYVTGWSWDGFPDYATIKYTQHDYCLRPIGGDLNGNCKVDFVDFAIVAAAWLGNDFADLKILAEDWLKCNFALEEDCW